MSLNQTVRTRTINEFKKGYQCRTNLVKDEKGDLLADSHKIVNRQMSYFCQLLNVQWVGGYEEDRNTDSRAICASA
jgi:hypothetical protein